MTIDQSPTLKPADLREALAEGKTLIDSAWLEKERQKRSANRVLIDPQKSVRTRGKIAHALRYEPMDETMHPIAEAIVAAETGLAEYDRKGVGLGGPIFYRVLSLRDIARYRSSIPGIESRLHRLMTAEWKSMLYELMVACSYLPSVQPEFVQETGQPVPDLALKTDPLCFAECKARNKYEQEVVGFTAVWRRESLVPIDEMLRGYRESFIVRVEVVSPQDIEIFRNEIPRQVRKMVREGSGEFISEGHFRVKVERWPESTINLPHPMSPIDQKMWKTVFEFDEWDQWHYLLPNGQVRILDNAPHLAVAVGKRVLICVRAEYLKDNKASLLSTLKDACKRQFRYHQPGVIHVLLDASLFGLGKLRRPEVIRQVLTPEIKELFRNYDRVWKIIIDIMSEPEGDFFKMEAHRIIATNSRVSNPPRGYTEPQRLLLV